MSDSIKVLIADDHDLFRAGLKTLLDKEEDIEVAGTVADGNELLTLLAEVMPDVVLMDLEMPNLDGIEATKIVRSKFPDVKILIVSGFSNARSVVETVKAGASGYILKNSDSKDLKEAIRILGTGNSFYSKEVFEILARHLSESKSHGFHDEIHLSSREKDILKLISNGFTNNEIAGKLFISTHTVVTHRRNLLQKINAKNTAELIKFASGKGYLD